MAGYSHGKPVLDTYQALVSTFSEFLTVAIHTILYERDIYPRTSFLKARKYNYPVRQNRHPKVCKWIQDAVAAVEAEMLKVSLWISILLFTLSCHLDEASTFTMTRNSSDEDWKLISASFLPDSIRFDLPAITRGQSVPGEGW